MSRNTVEARMPRRSGRDAERGQMVALMAGAIVALLALVGFAVDLGNSYLDRRAAQAVADTAADAGVQMLVNNYKNSGDATCNATASNAPCVYTDGQISAVVGDLIHRSTAGSSAITSYTASYTDATGAVTGSVGGGSIPSNTYGVKVVPVDQHQTVLLGLVGIHSSSEQASATSVYRVLESISTNSPNFFPYSVWYYNCSAGRVVKPGDTVIFQDDNWVQDTTCGSSKWQGTSTDFKGYIRDPSMPATISQGQTFPTKGGNACGTQDATALNNAYSSGQTIIMPVIDSENGNGSNMTMHISGFVALKVNGNYVCGSGIQTATVQGYIPPSYFTDGATGGGSGNCGSGGTLCYEPASIGLYQ